MKVKITKKDLKKAQAGIERGKFLSECCLIYQAAKRVGLPIVLVSYSFIKFKDRESFDLDESTRKITRANKKNWPQFVGQTIELPDLAD